MGPLITALCMIKTICCVEPGISGDRDGIFGSPGCFQGSRTGMFELEDASATLVRRPLKLRA
jgi:hypothetical protein